MDKPSGRGKSRGRGRGNQKEKQQQRPGPSQPAPPSTSQPSSNPWNKMPQQSQPQEQQAGPAQPAQPSTSQPSSNPWNKMPTPWNKETPPAAAPAPSTAVQSPAGTVPARAARPQKIPAESGGAGDSCGSGSIREQMSQMSIGPSGDVVDPSKKKFEKPEILQTRPIHAANKKGDYGRLVKLDTNYFRFSSTSEWSLYQYRVNFFPDEDRTRVKRRLFNRIPEHKFVPNIFDGNVLTTIHYEPQPLEFTVTHPEDEEKKVNIQIRFTITLQNKLDYGYIQLFNLLSRRGLENLELQLLGRNYYDRKKAVVIKEYMLEVWPGYLTSIRQHEQETLMCVEIIGKVMRQETIYDILVQCSKNFPQNFQIAFKGEILGTVVLTNYIDRTYKIDDVDFKVTPGSTFERDGEQISYAEYLRRKYQVNVRNMTQPMLVSKANARQRRSGMPELIYLIPELCRTTGLTDRMRNNFRLMKEVGQHTCCNPNIRIQRLMEFNKRMQENERTRVQWNQWGLSLGRDIVQVDGRVMASEVVQFGEGRKTTSTVDWTRELQSMKPFETGKLNNWFIIYHKNCKVIADMKTMLLKASKGMNFTIGNPQEVALPNDKTDTFVNIIESIMSKTTPQMIFFVLPSASAQRYSLIKQKCCVYRPVPSQVVREQSITKKNALSIMTNVVIQMNCKIGGVPWIVSLPAKNIMVIGFDVCHDTSKNGSDYGALVASINQDCTKYYSSVIAHNKGEEICDSIAKHIKDALESYKKHNGGEYPHRIFMYRDGVGEGQLNEVYKVEIQKIRGILRNTFKTPPSLTYIIVTKRINTRFFYNKENPEPGTIVDDVITDPDKYDFFLVSAKTTVGTITPTSYNVIYDENKLQPAQLQRFTFKLTYLYFNCSKTIRVPAPCHYAHKLAFLVSQFIHDSPSQNLSELLYFL